MYVKQAKENYIPPKMEKQNVVSFSNVLTSLSMNAGVNDFEMPESEVENFGTDGSSVGNFGRGE